MNCRCWHDSFCYISLGTKSGMRFDLWCGKTQLQWLHGLEGCRVISDWLTHWSFYEFTVNQYATSFGCLCKVKCLEYYEYEQACNKQCWHPEKSTFLDGNIPEHNGNVRISLIMNSKTPALGKQGAGCSLSWCSIRRNNFLITVSILCIRKESHDSFFFYEFFPFTW